MGKFVDKYSSWKDEKKNLFILACVALVGAIACIPFIVVDNIGVLFGWLLGSAVNIFAYYSIVKVSEATLDPDASSKRGYFMALFAMLRLALYAGVLFLAAFATFRWGSMAHGYCNIVSAALALMPTWIVVVITTFFRAKKEEKGTEDK
ncbi:MAG: hypothetical protein IJS37_01960 [Bacilli bacterium]|nr:hypothetical protein [Bacilli bacterium]